MDVGPDTERLQWIASNLHIITKSGTRVRLVPNSVQLMLHMAMQQQRVRGLPVRLEILKARQEGCSTWIEAEGFYEAFHRPNWRAMAVSVDADSTDHIFGITKLFDEDLPAGLRKEKDNTNRKEIKYSAPHRSSFLAQTAGKFSLGRSFTIQYLHCCVAEGTLIVTKDGRAVKIEQCVLGDPVQTHTGAASTISVWSMQQKRCKKFTFRGMRTLPLVATPEHKVWTREGWKPLGDMVLGECIGYPVKQIATTIRRLPFAQPAIRRPQNGGSAERVPATTKLDYALGRIVGFYLAEGTTSRQHKSPHQFCRTVFAVHEKEVPMVLEWLQPLRGLFCSARVRQPAKDSKTRCVDVHGKSLAAFITNLVGRTDEKHGPENWWRMPAEFIRGTVDGYLAGDGHFSKDPNSRTIRTSSIRPAITLYMRDAIASLGLGWPSIEFRDGGIRHGRNEKPQHTLTVTGDAVIAIAQGLGKPYTPRVRPTRGIAQPCRIEDGFAWIPLQSVSDAGERWVYDLEVAHDDHSYCVLQGAVSNSESAFWENAETQMSSLEEAVPMKPETTIIQETTANGQGGYFYQSWKENLNRRRGHPENFSGYIPVFFPWYIFPDYSIQPPSETIFTKEERAIRDQFQLTDGQLYWRRMKIESKNGDVSLFCQEYPACVVAGTRIGTDRGILPVEQIVAGDKVTFGIVDHVYGQRPSPVYRLVTSLGYSVEGTADHPIFLRDEFPLSGGSGNTIPLSECTKGMKVMLVSPRLAEYEYVERWQEAGVDCSIRITPEWGRLLGYFAGDGSYHADALSVVCDAKDEEVICDVDFLIRKLLGLSPSRRIVGTKGGGIELRVHAKRLRSAFGQLGIIEMREHKTRRIVKVPECIWRSPRSVILEFLRGVFEADGFCNKVSGDVKFFSKYPDFMRDIQILLLSFGITSRVTSVVKTHNDGHSYTGREMALRSRESFLFHKTVGFISKRKSGRSRCKTRDKGSVDLWDVVECVSRTGIETTFDLTVADGHAFDANGIKTHNTWQEGFQVSGNPVFSAEIVAGQSAFQKSSFQHVVLDEMGGSVEVVSCDEELNCWRVSSPPKDAHDYVIGIDTMEGRLSDVQNVRSNLDYDGMVVLDRNTGEVAALYHGRGDQRQLACQAFAAAIWYNEAFVAPEIPQGMVLLDYFKSRNYPYLYNRQRHEDRETETASEVLGWRTTAITRKWLVDDMVVACKEQSIKLIFPELIDEMRSFVRDKTGRPGHLPGEHDDLLFAGMIALQCHKRVPLSNKPYAYSHTGEDVKPAVDDNDLARTGAIDHWRPEEEDETDDFWSDHTD